MRLHRRVQCCSWSPSEIALLLLLLHRSRGVVVDDPTLALGGGRYQHLGDDVLEGFRIGLDGTREGIATQGTEADLPHLHLLAISQGEALVVNHDQCAVALDPRSEEPTSALQS